MAKSVEKYSTETLQRSPDKVVPSGTSEGPVLDLSCRKSLPSSSVPGSENESTILPPQASPFSDTSQQPNNNNNNKHANGYVHREPSQETVTESSHEIQSHPHYSQHQDDTNSFSTSNRERKSPFENRSYAMAPPSEPDSAKELRYNQYYTHYPFSVHQEEQRVPHHPYPTASFDTPGMLPLMPTVMFPLLPQAPVAPLSQPQPQQEPVQLQSPVPSSTHDPTPSTTTSPMITNPGEEPKYAPRPFNAYPMNRFKMTFGPDMIFDQDSRRAYADFRNRVLDSVKRTSKNSSSKTRHTPNSQMPPPSAETRRKNNEATKRSRNTKRTQKDEIAIRVAFLEQEYVKLKYENALLKEENMKMKCMIFSKF